MAATAQVARTSQTAIDPDDPVTGADSDRGALAMAMAAGQEDPALAMAAGQEDLALEIGRIDPAAVTGRDVPAKEIDPGDLVLAIDLDGPVMVIGLVVPEMVTDRVVLAMEIDQDALAMVIAPVGPEMVTALEDLATAIGRVDPATVLAVPVIDPVGPAAATGPIIDPTAFPIATAGTTGVATIGAT